MSHDRVIAVKSNAKDLRIALKRLVRACDILDTRMNVWMDGPLDKDYWDRTGQRIYDLFTECTNNAREALQ